MPLADEKNTRRNMASENSLWMKEGGGDGLCVLRNWRIHSYCVGEAGKKVILNFQSKMDQEILNRFCLKRERNVDFSAAALVSSSPPLRTQSPLATNSDCLSLSAAPCVWGPRPSRSRGSLAQHLLIHHKELLRIGHN